MKRKMTEQEKDDMKFIRFEDMLDEQMKDPEFKRLWDASRPYYQMVNALLDARSRGEITQRELARRLKTKQSAISRFESGKSKNPTLSFVQNMANALGLELEFVFKVKRKV